LTSCKSAKDRTSMSITWEQARVLCSYGLTEDDVLKVTNTMRARGVRRENAFKNIGMFDAHHKIKFGLASTQLNVALSLSLSLVVGYRYRQEEVCVQQVPIESDTRGLSCTQGNRWSHHHLICASQYAVFIIDSIDSVTLYHIHPHPHAHGHTHLIARTMEAHR
jgi:hypothetical protein